MCRLGGFQRREPPLRVVAVVPTGGTSWQRLGLGLEKVLHIGSNLGGSKGSQDANKGGIPKSAWVRFHVAPAVSLSGACREEASGEDPEHGTAGAAAICAVATGEALFPLWSGGRMTCATVGSPRDHNWVSHRRWRGKLQRDMGGQRQP